MKRQLPMMVCLLGGFFMLLQYFSPHPVLAKIYEELLNWTIVIGFFALGLGVISLWISHLPKVGKRASGWGYSAVTLIGFAATAVCGICFGQEETSPFVWIYNHVMNPMTATMFALLAFFIASAAYRAFRARSLLSAILLVAAVIVMLGRVPLGDYLLDPLVGVLPFHPHGVLAAVQEWLLTGPNLAAKRAVLIGVGFGGAAISLKIVLGIERSYLGGER